MRTGAPSSVLFFDTCAGDRDRFSYWSDAFLNVDRYTKDETKAAHTAFLAYMSDLLAATC
ncbi:hypothetical protein [Streptomyces sp. NPDC056948]|uniref:hypothetical protein n=1 Tax=Streptomyces sp. NPDC056948 TaxID=3345975 RepID=UPI00363A2C5A